MGSICVTLVDVFISSQYKSDESCKQLSIEMMVLDDPDKERERDLMVVLGTTNSSHLARDAVKRLTALQKLTGPGCSSTTISSM